MSQFAHELPFGANIVSRGATQFCIWAPDVDEVLLEVPGRHPLMLERDLDGSHSGVADVPEGTTYCYRVGPEMLVPDPASRLQLDDVHGPSVVVDPLAYPWQQRDWLGRPWAEMVIYEMHVGCYGGFAGVEAQIPRLVELGITAIELMPIADFSGRRNWGYDGVLPYAPDTAYGTPAELKHLIDTAHAYGVCIYLDVVYNHFGPEGNYLHTYASDFFSPTESSPWGAAIDFHQPAVRAFFTHNALYWLMEYRFDGLRFDAVHAISDPSWLDEMAAEVRKSCEPDRHIHLMLENERNRNTHLEKDFDAQWNDDMHNVVHVLLTNEDEGYYANYQENPTAQLARGLAEGFIYQGEPAPAHDNRPRGTPSAHLPLYQFVFFLQNHDQIGNRALGERLTILAQPEALKAAITLQLLNPQIPLIFMGEERGVTTPFLFFTDFHGELADAVREGRRREFRAFSQFSSPTGQESIPDPNDKATFNRSQEGLREVACVNHVQATHEEFYRRLLQLRQDTIVPHASSIKSLGASAVGPGSVIARWQLCPGETLTIAINLSASEQPVEKLAGEWLFESQPGAAKLATRGILAAGAASVFIDRGAL